jgi:SAM-dependent methyltransferase
VAGPEPDELRQAQRQNWDRAATAWGGRADFIRDWGMPVSAAMVDALALQPGQRVLELAAGPGDTGFMAAELVQPGGTLISSDGSEVMVEQARRRAEAAGLRNIEFRQLELEWIDLETASVDAVLCRWGIMLIVDPAAAAQEVRRVLKPRGRAAFAVWDVPERNPWATVPAQVMIARGHAEPPDPAGPGMFALAQEGALRELLEASGFADVVVGAQEVVRRYGAVDEFIAEHFEISPMHHDLYAGLSPEEQEGVAADIRAALDEYIGQDGSVTLPGSSLVAVATA